VKHPRDVTFDPYTPPMRDGDALYGHEKTLNELRPLHCCHCPWCDGCVCADENVVCWSDGCSPEET
jgi:hypothetical protein